MLNNIYRVNILLILFTGAFIVEMNAIEIDLSTINVKKYSTSQLNCYYISKPDPDLTVCRDKTIGEISGYIQDPQSGGFHNLTEEDAQKIFKIFQNIYLRNQLPEVIKIKPRKAE